MFLVPWFFAIVFAVADEVVVGMLLRLEYTQHKSKWEADGKPRSVFWVPEEARLGGGYVTYASGHAGHLTRWRWLFRSPEWMREIAGTRGLLLMHRIFLPGFWACAIAPLALAALSQ